MLGHFHKLCLSTLENVFPGAVHVCMGTVGVWCGSYWEWAAVFISISSSVLQGRNGKAGKMVAFGSSKVRKET